MPAMPARVPGMRAGRARTVSVRGAAAARHRGVRPLPARVPPARTAPRHDSHRPAGCRETVPRIFSGCRPRARPWLALRVAAADRSGARARTPCAHPRTDRGRRAHRRRRARRGGGAAPFPVRVVPARAPAPPGRRAGKRAPGPRARSRSRARSRARARACRCSRGSCPDRAEPRRGARGNSSRPDAA